MDGWLMTDKVAYERIGLQSICLLDMPQHKMKDKEKADLCLIL
jgi:hypothetical protein